MGWWSGRLTSCLPRYDKPPAVSGVVLITGGGRDVGAATALLLQKATLVGFLDYLRGAIAAKAEGVPYRQVRTAGVPSGTSLLGLVQTSCANKLTVSLAASRSHVADGIRRSAVRGRGCSIISPGDP